MEKNPLNYQFPYLYRYENQTHIDSFFDTGKILLSSFQAYKSYSDNQLGDSEEGKSKNFEGSFSNNLIKSVSKAHVEMGNNLYCFCTSTILDPKQFNVFNRDSVFRIIDIAGFGLALSKSISGSTGKILFGNCDYLYERVLKERIGATSIQFKPTDESIEPVEIPMGGLFGNRLLFIKLIKYQSQCEYRVLWPTVGQVSSSQLIDCPEAIKFCEKISKNEIEEVFKQLH